MAQCNLFVHVFLLARSAASHVGAMQRLTCWTANMSDVRPEIHAAPKHFKSHVWKNFGFHNLQGKNEIDTSHGVCKICHGKVKSKLLSANNKRWTHVSVSFPAVQKRLFASHNPYLILYAKSFIPLVWSKIQVFVI